MHGTEARAPELSRGLGVLGRPERDAPAGEGIPAGVREAAAGEAGRKLEGPGRDSPRPPAPRGAPHPPERRRVGPPVLQSY